MENTTKKLWEEMKAEADWQEKKAEDLILDPPSDAKSPEELYEELMKKVSDGTKSTFFGKK